MAVNFNDARCKSDTSEPVFGLVDVPPATISLDTAENWNVWIDNENEINITLTAIDGCIEIGKEEGERCEAILTYSNAIIFVELKDRNSGRWAGKARDQLENTIRLFKRDSVLEGYKRRYAQIANKQRPYFKSGGNSFIEKFENETGFILRVSDVIQIR
jgi:hypothetical protein